MSVHAAPVFDDLPTSSDVHDVHDRLNITSVVPFSHCSVCDGDVMAFSDGGSNTVFEVDVFFYENLDCRVTLAGVNSSF